MWVDITSRGATAYKKKKHTGFRIQIQHKKSKSHSKESFIARQRRHLIEALQPIVPALSIQAKTAAVNTNSAGMKPTEMAATPSVSSGAVVVSASCTAAVPI